MRKTTLNWLAIVSFWLAAIVPAQATTYAGVFADDDDIAWISFSLTVPAEIRIFTHGYLHGAFDPLLSLFDSADMLIALSSDDPALPPDPANGLSWDDSLFFPLLASGDYLLALTQYGNGPVGPMRADGFVHTGNPDYTDYFGLGQRFVDYTGSARSGDWAVTITEADSPNPVPEPASASLLAAGLLLVARSSRRHTARRPQSRPA